MITLDLGMGPIYYTFLHSYELLEIFSGLTSLVVGYLIFGLMREWFYIITANIGFDFIRSLNFFSGEMDAI